MRLPVGAVAVSGGPGAAPGIYATGVTSKSGVSSWLTGGSVSVPGSPTSYSGTISGPAPTGYGPTTVSAPPAASYPSNALSGQSTYTGSITSTSSNPTTWTSTDRYVSPSSNCTGTATTSCNRS